MMGALDDAAGAERQGDHSDELEMGYFTVQPNRWTFAETKIRRWVEQRLRGRVLNACAGKTKLAHDHEIVRNDIDETRDADVHVDVCEISNHFPAESFDTILYDPPFSENQANRSYELEDGEAVVAGNDAVAKRQFDDLLRPGGRVIQFGYTTTCMPMSLGYERREVAVWNTLGRMNDYLSVVDEKPGELEAGPKWFAANE
jgi:hypothetical protein